LVNMPYWSCAPQYCKACKKNRDPASCAGRSLCLCKVVLSLPACSVDHSYCYILMTAPAGYVTQFGVFGSNRSVRATAPCGLINSTEWGSLCFADQGTTLCGCVAVLCEWITKPRRLTIIRRARRDTGLVRRRTWII